MQNKHPIITYAYHFICEAIILFLVCLPIMYYKFEWVPYGSFLILTIGICLLFSVVSVFSNRHLWYIIAVPLMFLIFYSCGYPIILSIVFPIALTWRYINIRNEIILSREMGYIQLTLVLATGLVLLIGNYQIILYAFLQFLIVIVGYISSHLSVIEKDERKRFDKKLWLYIGFMLTAGSSVIFLLFDSGRYVFLKIGEVLSYIAAVVVSKLGVFLQFLDFNKVQLPENSQAMEMQQDQLNQMRQGNDVSLIEKIPSYFYWIIAAVIVGTLFLMFLRKTKFRRVEQLKVSEAISYGDLDEKSNKHDRKIGFRSKKKPSHPVRKLVYQFERKASKSSYGRNSFETLEEWLSRIGFGDNLAVYQKVRYGEMANVSESEVHELREKLQLAEAKFNEQR